MTAAIRGTITTRSHESVASSRTAMNTPPTAMIGALTRIVRAIWRKSCTCWMSFVLRVMSDAVPNRFISRAEKLCTRSKTAARTSRPTLIEVSDAKYTAMIANTPRTERDPEHESADTPDVVRVALGDPVIDDVGVEVGEVEVRDRLQEQERG